MNTRGKKVRCGVIHVPSYEPPTDPLVAYGTIQPIQRCTKKACHKGPHKWVIHDWKKRNEAVCLEFVREVL